MKTKSNLERVLGEGHFAVTAELSPPQNADREVIRSKASVLKGYVDAFSVTDGQSAVVAMASWAACLIGKDEGLDPIVHMTCRDRNRIALQMDILGVAALGIDNVLCVSGDPISFGNYPEARYVSDVDSVQLVKIVKDLRDENRFLNEEPVVGRRPELFIGAVANPFLELPETEVDRLERKVDAGADFIQTQGVYNVEKFERWMQVVRERGLQSRVKILAGITPLKTVGAARYMKASIAGVDIPDELIERLRKLPTKERVSKEGIRIAVETISRLKEMEGVAGVHIMAAEWEEAMREICELGGLCPRPCFEELVVLE
jgi:methylenetetrahydrofolate reductase (NADPH)